jgi:hypothetical protein
MAKQAKTLERPLHETLKDIYYAEKKILTALPKMAKAAQSEELQAAFEKHENETEGQVERLEQVFEHRTAGKRQDRDAINGLIDEQGIHEGIWGSSALDAACRPHRRSSITRFPLWDAEVVGAADGPDAGGPAFDETLRRRRRPMRP